MATTEKVFPTVEQLTALETKTICPELGCSATFKCKSNLNMHLAKHHGNIECAEKIRKASNLTEFHCPLKSCIYHTNKSFKLMKYLRQHYIKVHSERKHVCSKCNLAFPSETLKKLHEDYCGVTFYCPECTVKYTCYDTLSTHARRKKHNIYPKINYKSLYNGDINACSRIICLIEPQGGIPKEQLILPKDLLIPSDSSCNVIPAGPDFDSKGVKRKRKGTEVETQTHFQTVLSTSETQTEVVSVHAQEVNTSTLIKPNKVKKSTKTQTTTVSSSSRACNTSSQMDSSLILDGDFLEVETNTLGTQTLCPSIFSASAPGQEANEIQLTTNSPENLLDVYMNDIGSSNYCNTDMETQTDWFNSSELDMLANEVQATNFTQTCDDILPPDLRFNNTHTQTVLNDILRSVGSQTNHLRSNGSFCTSETQTDSIFEVLLEEINS